MIVEKISEKSFIFKSTERLKKTGRRAMGKGDPCNSEHSDGGADKVKCLKRPKILARSSPCRPFIS